MRKGPHYRKLPGHRRGFLRGSSMWLGPDYLLLVRSLRFREEYKRYYFRDIQAIVTAEAPRFHISTRFAAIAALLLTAWPFVLAAPARLGISSAGMLGGMAAVVALAWFLVSGFFSCRCRIYTAVSCDDLPSVYRTWTARKFLLTVEPLIQQAQGSLEASWVRAVGEWNIGPRETSAAPAPAFDSPLAARASFPMIGSAALIASLFADAIWNTITLHSNERWTQVTNGLLTLVEAGAAIVVIAHHFRARPGQGKDHRSKASKAMQRLAIATLTVMAGFSYLSPFAYAWIAGVQASAGGRPIEVTLPIDPYLHQIDAVLAAVLGLVGLAIIWYHREDDSGIIYPSS